MANFPVLGTGAVMQYPAYKDVRYSTNVVRFVDGSEQRFRLYPSPLHSWTVRLNLLSESELSELREFFRQQSGMFASFAFTDPWDGTTYPICNLDSDTMNDTLQDISNASTTLIVRESRS